MEHPGSLRAHKSPRLGAGGVESGLGPSKKVRVVPQVRLGWVGSCWANRAQPEPNPDPTEAPTEPGTSPGAYCAKPAPKLAPTRAQPWGFAIESFYKGPSLSLRFVADRASLRPSPPGGGATWLPFCWGFAIESSEKRPR